MCIRDRIEPSARSVLQKSHGSRPASDQGAVVSTQLYRPRPTAQRDAGRRRRQKGGRCGSESRWIYRQSGSRCIGQSRASVELKSLAFPRASASGIAPAERGFLRFEGSRVHLKTYPTPSVCFLRDATPVPRPSPRLRRSGLQHLVRARNRLAPTGSGVTAMNQGRLAACTSRRWRDTAQRSIHLPRYWRCLLYTSLSCHPWRL